MASNSRMQGVVGVGSAVSYFTMNEIPVFIPLSEYTDYDLVVDMGGLKKVQVRTSRFKNEQGRYAVNMKVCGGNAKANKIHKVGSDMVYDYLFVHLDDGRNYFIPKDVIANVRSQIVMGKKYEKYRVSMQVAKAC